MRPAIPILLWAAVAAAAPVPIVHKEGSVTSYSPSIIPSLDLNPSETPTINNTEHGSQESLIDQKITEVSFGTTSQTAATTDEPTGHKPGVVHPQDSIRKLGWNDHHRISPHRAESLWVFEDHRSLDPASHLGQVPIYRIGWFSVRSEWEEERHRLFRRPFVDEM
ncbi:hypothetical protein BJ742DRAFT_75442 [Cladochytrium replicatum]|nr:hypothetical protein BJ742DRAFT_75442 [Cladochytrium replicatum]